MPPLRPANAEELARRDRIEAILDRFAVAIGPSMVDFDALEYDRDGNPR